MNWFDDLLFFLREFIPFALLGFAMWLAGRAMEWW